MLNSKISVAPIASRESMIDDESLACTNALTATPAIIDVIFVGAGCMITDE